MAIATTLLGNLAGGTGISWIELPTFIDGNLPPNTVTVDVPSIILATAEGVAATLIYELEDGIAVYANTTGKLSLQGDDAQESGNTVAITASAGEYVVLAMGEQGYLPCRYALIPLEG